MSNLKIFFGFFFVFCFFPFIICHSKKKHTDKKSTFTKEKLFLSVFSNEKKYFLIDKKKLNLLEILCKVISKNRLKTKIQIMDSFKNPLREISEKSYNYNNFVKIKK